MDNSAAKTEILGLQVALDNSRLLVMSHGAPLIVPLSLSPDDAERLSLEMTKAQLPEWNQFEQMKSRAELRYRRYLGAWLVMCLAAFSAYLGYPGYLLPVFFSFLSVFLWWRAGYEEQRAEREAQSQRNTFRPDWDYVRQRLEEEGVEL